MRKIAKNNRFCWNNFWRGYVYLLIALFCAGASSSVQALTLGLKKNPLEQLDKQTLLYAVHSGTELYMDCYRDPEVKIEKESPVLLYSFGGGWEIGSREDQMARAFFDYFASRGYLICSIDYRLYMKEFKSQKQNTNWVEAIPTAIEKGTEDLYAATAYLIEHEKELGCDSDKIILAGSSAGAINSLHAVYWQCSRTDLAKQYLPLKFKYAGLISMAGALWLEGKETALDWKHKPCPILFFHGEKDQLVPYDEQHEIWSVYGPKYLFKQLREMDSPVWFYDFEEGDHLLAVYPMTAYLAEMEIFCRSLVMEKKKRYIHTREKTARPIQFKSSFFLDWNPPEKKID